MAVPRVSSLSSLSTLDSEIGLAKKLWNKCRRETTFALYTPFTVCLASGNLKVDSFRHYISQDVCFLKAFAQAYELAEEYADDDDEKFAIAELRKGILKELKMYYSFVQEWGTDSNAEITHNPATVRYTNFLLATTSGKVEGQKAPGKLATPFEKTKVAAYTLGAMTPCMRLYAFFGKEFQKFVHPNEESHPYMKWIETYSSESFQASALQTEDLLDKLSVSLTGEELDIIEKLYYQAMKLEIEFFNAQPLSQPVNAPLIKDPKFTEDRLMLFSDFDLTCTVLDSSAILAEIAIVTAPKLDQPQLETPTDRMSSADLRKTWEILSNRYVEEHEQCMESIMASGKAEEFKYEVLEKALEQLAEFEKRANDRVIESEVLKGLNIEDIKRAGERLILQDGCTAFFQKLIQSNNIDLKVHILSYCWCGCLIRSAFSSAGLDTLSIHANELVFSDSVSTGEILKIMESPINKVQAFHNILKDCEDKRNVRVYVGDSVGDILCLLEADIGIVIGNSTSLRKIAAHFGISFVPLFSGLVMKQKECREGSPSKWNSRTGILYTVSSWAEIHAFILGW
ncbi:hypothetical protein SAY87_009266 [Trapa incisa]|uniref:Thiaminase-2/PQQC domain-containing protein n=1 Tax=Trapa incisa TaxID=236973 RepID=A0AAN7PXG1_9MYRT|nr:hypothetical protein SAY87_009266 [Trapa incisa]